MLYLFASQSELFQEEALQGLSYFFGGAFTYFIYRNISHVNKQWIGSLIEAVLLL